MRTPIGLESSSVTAKVLKKRIKEPVAIRRTKTATSATASATMIFPPNPVTPSSVMDDGKKN